MKLKTKIFYACCSALCAVWGLSAQQKIQQASVKDRGLVISLKNTDRNTILDTDGLYQCKIEMGEIVRYSFLRMKNEEKKTTENTTKLNVVNKPDSLSRLLRDILRRNLQHKCTAGTHSPPRYFPNLST